MTRTPSAILIIGACSAIGRSVAHRFVRAGWDVGLVDPNGEQLEALADELGVDVFRRSADASDDEAIQETIADFGERTGGRLDVLLNASGVTQSGRFEQLDLSAHRRHVDGNLWAMLAATHAAFPLLRDTPGARVISIASVSSMYGTPDLASYSAAKAGVRTLTQALNLEWAHHDIHVCDVIPPHVDGSEGEAAQDTVPARSRRHLAPNVTVEDVADVVQEAVVEDRIHWPVGSQFRWIYRLSDVLPAPLVRLLMRYVSGF